MRVFVVGSKDWVDYNEIMRNLTIILEELKYESDGDKFLTFIHKGTWGAETMVTEYIGKISKFMKQKGFTIKEQLIPINANAVNSDFDVITSGIDRAIIFKKNNCKRSEYCAKILAQFEIPTKIVRG